MCLRGSCWLPRSHRRTVGVSVTVDVRSELARDIGDGTDEGVIAVCAPDQHQNQGWHVAYRHGDDVVAVGRDGIRTYRVHDATLRDEWDDLLVGSNGMRAADRPSRGR